MHALEGHSSWVHALDFSPDGGSWRPAATMLRRGANVNSGRLPQAKNASDLSELTLAINALAFLTEKP